MKWESYSHPISDIRDWDNNNRLELKPDFQRNEVWSRAAQIMLIDTIIKGIPIPKIYIKSVMHNGNTYRVVIDGQQRLTAILITNKCRSLEPLVPYLESVSRTMLYPVSTLKSCDVSFEEQAHITL